MNARNLSYIREYNPRVGFGIADDKLRTKRLLEKNNIPTPKLFGFIRNERDVAEFEWEQLPKSFVVKPNRGYGGGGIKVVYNRKESGRWIGGGGQELTFFDLLSHVKNILDGQFSLANVPDIAFFEDRVKISKTFKLYAYRGIPDVRVIMFNGIPVMAMLRLPTRQSDGKANLAQGGVGVGIDMASGVTTTAMRKAGWTDKIIERHPDNGLELRGINVPYWRDILQIAVRCQKVCKLGFLGVDIAIDRDEGPVVLELNARAGLSIQVANLAPLRERLRRVRGLSVKTVDKGVRLGRELFGGEVEQNVEGITGRQVIGLVEHVNIPRGENEEPLTLDAKVDTGADSTSIDYELARDLGFGDVIDDFLSFDLPKDVPREQAQEVNAEVRTKYLTGNRRMTDIVFVYSSSGFSIRPKVLLTYELLGRKIVTNVSLIPRAGLKYQMIVGRKDLKRFLVDPTK